MPSVRPAGLEPATHGLEGRHRNVEFHGDTGAVVRSWCGGLGNAEGATARAVLALASQRNAVPVLLMEALALAVLQHPAVALARQVMAGSEHVQEQAIQLAELLLSGVDVVG